ncbi:unnamed protein product, partial [Rotaria magnacalcarata]
MLFNGSSLKYNTDEHLSTEVYNYNDARGGFK